MLPFLGRDRRGHDLWHLHPPLDGINPRPRDSQYSDRNSVTGIYMKRSHHMSVSSTVRPLLPFLWWCHFPSSFLHGYQKLVSDAASVTAGGHGQGGGGRPRSRVRAVL